MKQGSRGKGFYLPLVFDEVFEKFINMLNPPNRTFECDKCPEELPEGDTENKLAVQSESRSLPCSQTTHSKQEILGGPEQRLQ